MIIFFLILFFASLLSIIIMIGRKFVLLNNGQTLSNEKVLFETPYLEDLKHSTVKNIKKYGYNLLVAILRIYVRSSNFLKNKYQEIKIKIKERARSNNINNEKKEASKFLKMISEYKRKVREIKHKIHEEENSL